MIEVHMEKKQKGIVNQITSMFAPPTVASFPLVDDEMTSTKNEFHNLSKTDNKKVM